MRIEGIKYIYVGNRCTARLVGTQLVRMPAGSLGDYFSCLSWLKEKGVEFEECAQS